MTDTTDNDDSKARPVDPQVEAEVDGSATIAVSRAPDADTASPDTADRVKVPEELPVLTVRNAIVFPGTIMPLSVGREKSKRVVAHVLRGDKLIGVVAQRQPDVEDPTLDDLYRIGTVGLVLKLLNMPDGTQSIIVHGLARFGVESVLQQEPFILARAHSRYDEVEQTPEVEALTHTVRQQALEVIGMLPGVPDEARVVLNNLDTPGALADFLSANLSLDLPQKQELLETFDVAERLRKISEMLTSQLEMLELSKKIQDEVKGRIEKNQREYYLQEQLKAIQQELGQTDARTAEIEDFRARVKAAHMPDLVATEAERELSRLQKIPQASPEYSVTVDYVTWLCELPWSRSTEDSLDIDKAEKVLDEDHHDLAKIKKRILEFLAVRKLRPEGRGPILCFAGPPGVGKTSLGQSIARALGRHFIRMSVGGVRDEADIRGHRRTYIGALPGRIIQEIRKADSNNPVFMLDEVDKMGQDFRGDPSSALLEVLDPEQNHSFTDHYLGVPFDLSHVMFIATANYVDPIPPALRDRMEVMELPGYTEADKLHIAKRYLVPRQRKQNGLAADQARFTDAALRDIIAGYTREAGVRNLEREIGAVCRGIAARIARGQTQTTTVTPRKLETYLGPVRFLSELAQRTSVPGVVTGLAFTPTGGTIIFVEATRMPGKGSLTLTGQIGDVMRESAHAAFSLVRSRAGALHIDGEALARSDVHIHVPAGAIPKDGPSAGVAMTTALVSLLTDRPCRHDVGMTGEITLRGLVLPIGGIKEKVLAAQRAGIKTVILPEQNRKDLVDVPKDTREKLEFIFVERIDQVLHHALEKPRERTTKRKPSKKKRAKNRPTRKPTAKKSPSPTKRRSATRSSAKRASARR
jgi:ATP-dependent Lon protease